MTKRHQQILFRDAAQLQRAILYMLLAVLFIVSAGVAQQVDLAAKLRLAQNFEEAGEWDKAALLYESLLVANPGSVVILDGLRRSYTELKQYNKAIDLIRRQLVPKPTDENLLSILGGLYDLAGQPEAADSIWRSVIRKDPQNAGLYRLIANQLIEHREYEKAILIYVEGREAIKNAMLFLEELASLYGALHQYDAVTREYVKLVRSNPQQVTYVQGRLASFTGRAEAQRAALAVVQQEVLRTPAEAPLRSLLAWLHMEGKEYAAAFDEYRQIDRLTKANGNEIFQFAQRAAQERVYAVSAKAFREVAEQSTRREIIPFARFGYARAIEELSVESDSFAQASGGQPIGRPARSSSAGASETQPTFQGALGLYEKIAADYPNSEITMQALYRIGTIRFERFFDLDGALTAFAAVRALPHNMNLVYEAATKIAEVQAARNDLVRARREYEQLLRLAPEQYRDRVMYRLAELDYFEARFDSAAAVLQRISTNPGNDITNDALQLLYFVQENRMAGQEALAQFARGDLLMRQRKYSEASALFGSVGARFGGTTLADDSHMRIGELNLSLDMVDSALAVFQKIVKDMPTSILRDRAQMRIGEVYQTRLKNKQKAIEAYEALLANFPSSLFVEEARKRIRTLRGDIL